MCGNDFKWSIMKFFLKKHFLITMLLPVFACSKKSVIIPDTVLPPVEMRLESKKINGQVVSNSFVQLYSNEAAIRLGFSEKVERNSVSATISWSETNVATGVPFTVSFSNGDSVLNLKPGSPLNFLTQYTVTIAEKLASTNGARLSSSFVLKVRTGIDSSNKYPLITDDALLDSVQKKTFRYFWDYGHSVSGLARDKTNTSDLDDCSIGGTGFGILCIPIAANRNFITRAEGLARMQKIAGFLKLKAKTFHGAFPHRMNGITGDVIVWSPKDDGADLVETSFLMMGLLTARQYFNNADTGESLLRDDINTLFNNVDWTWFKKDNQNALYWLWSPTYNWGNSFMVRGWNETLLICWQQLPPHIRSQKMFMTMDLPTMVLLKTGNNIMA